MRLFINLTFAVLALVLGASAQEKIDRDTVYTMSPVTTTAIYAMPRISPVTFSNVSRTDIQTQYSTQDVPALLFRIAVGNVSIRKTAMPLEVQAIWPYALWPRRLSVMVNGVPQNDLKIKMSTGSIFPICSAVLQLASLARLQGSAFYGPPAIGVGQSDAIPFQSKRCYNWSSTGFRIRFIKNTLRCRRKKYSTTSFRSGG